jgi:type IV secretion system protein VirB2
MHVLLRNQFRKYRAPQVIRVAALLLLTALFCAQPVFAQSTTSSPFDTGFANLQALFTGTVAKVTSLIAIVLGGLGFATGDPGAKRNLAGVAVGIGIAVLAVNVLSWLWGA